MQREYNQLVATIKQAGRRALDLADRGFEVHTKKDRSPVTTADFEVNRILFEMQQEHFPDDGWLSEESPDDHNRLGSTRVWIVDPIDGTRAYINRLPEFCISVALVQGHSPILGAIFNPSTDELFTAVRAQGLLVNGKPFVPPPCLRSKPLVLVSPREFNSGRWADFLDRVECRPAHSIANALASVAAGRVQAVLTIEPENEWDLAAGAILIEESGGSVSDGAGQPLAFNQPAPQFTGVIAVAATAEPNFMSLLQARADQARSRNGRTGRRV
ncbi:3'(2'),5'-bisphosphate nucleotidase CysQ [Petrachloros mirabilis]